jgi:hypothetical protein
MDYACVQCQIRAPVIGRVCNVCYYNNKAAAGHVDESDKCVVCHSMLNNIGVCMPCKKQEAGDKDMFRLRCGTCQYAVNSQGKCEMCLLKKANENCRKTSCKNCQFPVIYQDQLCKKCFDYVPQHVPVAAQQEHVAKQHDERQQKECDWCGAMAQGDLCDSCLAVKLSSE